MAMPDLTQRFEGKNCDPIVVACVIFEKVPHEKLKKPVIDLVRHVTSDPEIDHEILPLAMEFCKGVLVEIPKASYIKTHVLAFQSLVSYLHEATSTKKTMMRYREKVKLQGICVQPPDGSVKIKWQEFKLRRWNDKL